jgi:hypothetical protein
MSKNRSVHKERVMKRDRQLNAQNRGSMVNKLSFPIESPNIYFKKLPCKSEDLGVKEIYGIKFAFPAK